MSKTSAKAPPDTDRGYNADAKAQARESEPVTIGGVVYVPVRQTTNVMRTVREIGRDQERAGRKARRKLLDAAKLLEQAEGVEIDRLRDALDAEGVTDERRRELEAQIAGLEAELTDERRDELERQAEELEDEANEIAEAQTRATFRMLSVLLRAEGEGGDHPPVDALEAELALADAEGLSRYLVRDESSEDPTPPTPTTTT